MFIPLKNQKEEYLSKEENILKMKRAFYDYHTETKEIIKVFFLCLLFYLYFKKISYFTRFTCGNLLFGDTDFEPNIAASLLKCIKKVTNIEDDIKLIFIK